jgi:hypothetical protein
MSGNRRANAEFDNFDRTMCELMEVPHSEIITLESVSKHATLTPFRMNTYEKEGGGEG